MRKYQRGVFDTGLTLIFLGAFGVGSLGGLSGFKSPACMSKPDTYVKAPGANYSYKVTACEAERKGK